MVVIVVDHVDNDAQLAGVRAERHKGHPANLNRLCKRLRQRRIMKNKWFLLNIAYAISYTFYSLKISICI